MEGRTELWRRWAPAIAIFVLIALIVWARLVAEPISPYGSNGAAYIEHGSRVAAALTVERFVGGEDWADGESLVAALDDSFPPFLHVMALPLTWLFAGRVGPVVAWGVVWVLFFGLAVGRIATLVSGRAEAGVLVAAGVFLLPGLHGSAARYYFDLPMSMFLWLSVAALMHDWHRRPWIGGVSGGLLGAAACLTKWTALPFLVVMIVGAALTAQVDEAGVKPRRDLQSRLQALTAYGLSLAIVTGSWLLAAGPDNSLAFTTKESALGGSHEGEGGGFVEAVLGMPATLLRSDPDRAHRLEEHLEGLTFAVFSPLLLAATLILIALWTLRSRRGGALVLGTVVGQLGFLIVWIKPIDERFLLGLAPALVLAGGLGLDTLPARLRSLVAGALAAAGLLVAVDFHHLPKTPLTSLGTEWEMWGPRFAPYPPPPRPRGLGASTSAQGRGWVRRDEAQDHRSALRAALLDRVEGCQIGLFAALDGKPFITVDGSHDWLGFEMQRRLLDAPQQEVPNVFPLNWEPDPDYQPIPGDFSAPAIHRCIDEDELPQSTVVLTDAGERLVPPRCPANAAWTHVATVDDPDGGWGLALWSPFGVDVCAPDAPPAFPAPEEL